MTAKTKSDRFRRLISHGFFAPELPPCFVSDDLARYRKAIFDRISALPQNRGKPNYYTYISEPIWFYFPRFGRDDRRHGVPNPISYLLLSKVVADNYVQLRRVAKKSKISASPPVFDWSGPRAVMRPSIDFRDDFRIDLSSRREEYAAADIRAFFHSIYTHAIPWAIYGKEWAKNGANRGYAHFGNLIDLLSRNLQDGQTIGLPVGPDTSRLLAEVVASGIDELLRERLKISGRDASRYIDDYTISAPDGQAGENLIAALRQSAAHFELELNSEKSAVVSTATRHDVGWKQAVRGTIPKGVPNTQSMQHFFYEVGQLCEAHKSINVEKFAFANARSAFVLANDWHRIQSLLINAYRRNSTLVSLLVEIFILRQVEHGDLDLASLKEFVDHRIPVLARANRTGEIIWLLFLTIRLNVTLAENAVAPLYSMQNAMVALLVAFAASRQLVSGQVDFSVWNSSCDADGLRGQMWLYAYEAPVRGIAIDIDTAFIEEDSYFSALHARKVRFLDIDNGFSSIATTLRALRDDNSRIRRVRADFLEDFDVNIDEYDDDDFDDEEFEDDAEY
ncbi:RNA-directed DNA polymerase [Sedimentimonas flavescens]|uniref:RNA-directed DNA polymerase n=1 Tax=Sedimentimonas flavescens TaxID=2851012 RepID=UPI0021A8EEC8|nr:RNA-directed DNA polymerase [Sedimentimonas flavescens]MCT2539974.1 RNA-directed DNA polymerase [Sedimentimonas flavescens]